VLLLVGAPAGTYFFMKRAEAKRTAEALRQDKAAVGRRERAAPIAAIALAPLPVKSPLVERPGKDEFGYPRSYVDKGGVRALLARKKHAELSAYFEEFQREFESDLRNEFFIQDAADAFSSAEAELGKQLDAWVAATPGSFAPYLARAAHLLDIGYAARGDQYRKDTDHSNFVEMRKAFERAISDLDRALALSPRLMPAMRYRIATAYTGSRLRFGEEVARAFAACPACSLVRAIEQSGLAPRWGGTHRAMEAAAAAAPVADNPRLKLLPGYAAIDRADGFIRDNQLERAMEHTERACALGNNADFLAVKARILRRQKDVSGARLVLTQALDLRPSRSDLLFDRVQAESQARPPDWRAAYADLTAGLRVDPTHADARRLLPYVVKGLAVLGWKAHEQGKGDEALELLDMAAELDPNRDVEGRRVAVLTAGFHGKESELTALEQASRAAPDDFQSRLRLDYALSRSHAWSRILTMWNEYLMRHPEDARAYRERAGTFYRLGRKTEAYADAQRACDLGSSAGCSLLRR
jgi:tetratricopeptide (TPR) repeat protein